MNTGKSLASRILRHTSVLLVIAAGFACILSAFSLDDAEASGPGLPADGGADASDEEDAEASNPSSATGGADAFDAGLRIPLDEIKPQNPLMRGKLFGSISAGSFDHRGWGGSFHAAVAPWVAERFSGFVEFGFRGYRNNTNYLELALAPSFTVASFPSWSFDIAPVVGGAMGGFDQGSSGGKRVQALAGGELSGWWTGRDGPPDTSARDIRIVNGLKDLVDKYRDECKDEKTESCQERLERIRLHLEQIGDPKGERDCDFSGINPNKGLERAVTPRLLAAIDRCVSAVAERRKTDSRTKAGLIIRGLHVAGRGLPAFSTVDFGLGLVF